MWIGSCLHKEIHPTLLLGVQKCVCFLGFFFFFFPLLFVLFFFFVFFFFTTKHNVLSLVFACVFLFIFVVHAVTFGGYGFWWLYDFLRVATGGFTDGQGRSLGSDQNIHVLLVNLNIFFFLTFLFMELFFLFFFFFRYAIIF